MQAKMSKTMVHAGYINELKDAQNGSQAFQTYGMTVACDGNIELACLGLAVGNGNGNGSKRDACQS
jgi:hypothetical protein